jgi:hypothetical protein
MHANICFSEKIITMIPVSSLIQQYVESLDWTHPEAIWKQYDGIFKQTRKGLYDGLMEDLSNSNNITISGASHTLVPLAVFNREYSMDIVPTSSTGLVLNPHTVFVDMEN